MGDVKNDIAEEAVEIRVAKNGLTSQDYVHLHNHTHYSLLDGLQKVPDMIAGVKEMGMTSIAMTDHGTMTGAIEFYKEAKAAGIKPIIGMETYVASRKHTDRDAQLDKGRFHLILLAMNQQGYENLMRLSTIANLEGFYYKPRVDHDLLEKYNECLIVLSGCIGGEVGEALRQNNYEKAKEIASLYKSVFGDRYYLEIQDHGHPNAPLKWDEQEFVNGKLKQLADELDIKRVVTCDAHYLNESDQEAHEILLCVQTQAFLSETNRMSLKDFHLHVTDPIEMIDRWADDPDVITNTRDIAGRCNLELELGKILIPKFDVPKGDTEKSYLEKLVYKGLVRRYGVAGSDKQIRESGKALKPVQIKADVEVSVVEKLVNVSEVKKNLPEHVITRADYELSVIDGMGFNGYFLMVSDFINWGKGEGIVFGPGRGSAAGSIVAYAMRITELDPLEYDLLFERFLNPDRISMPDIDIDIQDTRRDEVIQYCVNKYGKDRVANIITFGKMMGRNAIRDVARVMQIPYSESDRLAKLVPPPVQGRHIPLKKSIVDNHDLKQEYESSALSKQIIDLAIKIEGTIRSHGVHAAGVVIAPDDIVKYTPLEMAQKGVISTQYSMNPIEDLGLLKMDFLGLKNLTVIKNCLRIIKRVYGQDIDIDNLPLDDPETYELLQRAETTGVFQFESSGMKRYLKELKPTLFDDLIAMGALYRPGPLGAGLTDSYIKRKNGLEEISYPHELMKRALEPTYGVLVYQEQVMLISRDACGFTGGEADTLRKAIGKKKRDVMEKMQVQFVEGAVKNGVPRAVIEKFWDDLLGFADYCFNKSHSACYGMISYQTAYLKAHYPSAFMAAVMTSDYGDTDRLSIEISECTHLGIDVLPPDVNESYSEFAVVPAGDPKTDKIRFGLMAVKNVGAGAVADMIKIRDEAGQFTSIEDFIKKVNVPSFNRKTWESLIKAGAYDSFGGRSKVFHNLDSILSYASRVHKGGAAGQDDLFGGLLNTDEYLGQVEWSTAIPELLEKDKLTWERELLGLYLSSHPLAEYNKYLAEQTLNFIRFDAKLDQRLVTVGGLVKVARVINTKAGSKMAFVQLEDETGEYEVIVFPTVLEKFAQLFEVDKVLKLTGKISARERDGTLSQSIKILAEDVGELSVADVADYVSTGIEYAIPEAGSNPRKGAKAAPAIGKTIYLRVIDATNQDVLIGIKKLIESSPGNTPVVLVLGEADSKTPMKLPQKSSTELKLLGALKDFIGAENVVLK
jgi:DNA polymerase III subunit alpha